MIAMKFTIELDIGLSVLLQAALPQLVTDRETKTHRRGRSKRSYGHCRRRTEDPGSGTATGTLRGHAGRTSSVINIRVTSGSNTGTRPAVVPRLRRAARQRATKRTRQPVPSAVSTL